MAAAVVEPSPKRGGLTPKRTEAMPKNTLFGSNLERLNSDEKKQVRELDFDNYQQNLNKERQLKQDKYKVTAPAHLRTFLSDDPLRYSQKELDVQAQQTMKAIRLVDILEQKSRYFSVGPIRPQKASGMRPKDSSRINLKALEQGNEVNRIGTIGTKYKPASASYALAGEPRQLSMDFQNSVPAVKKRPHVFRLEHMRPPDHRPIEFYMKKSAADDDEICAIKLPANIRHQFGTKICHNVLSDKHKVDDTLDQQKKNDEAFLKSHREETRHISLESMIDPEYESLGAALRLDFFPGHSYNHKKSVARSVYTDDVHAQRVPDPDEHRYQRDYLSTWAEQNVLRDRVKKAWDAYLQETLAKK